MQQHDDKKGVFCQQNNFDLNAVLLSGKNFSLNATVAIRLVWISLSEDFNVFTSTALSMFHRSC